MVLQSVLGKIKSSGHLEEGFWFPIMLPVCI